MENQSVSKQYLNFPQAGGALDCLKPMQPSLINPRRACAERVTVVVSCVCVCVCLCVYLSVCLSVCLSEHAILAVRAIRSITKDAIVLNVRFVAKLKKFFFLKIVLFES